jgi:hypothetical protein
VEQKTHLSTIKDISNVEIPLETILRLVRESLDSAAFQTAHIPPMSELHAQLVQQRLGVLQVSGVEAFGEPVVNFGESRQTIRVSKASSVKS